MRSNKQKDIKIQKSGFKRSKFNWSHDVNTTYSWGEIQPTQCKLLVPGSKTTMQAQNLIRLAPMVAPTFGRVKYKTYNQFVPLAEVFPNFDAMMAQEPKTTAGGTAVPTVIPTTNLGMLSSLILHGSRCTCYFAIDTTDGNTAEQNAALGRYITCYRKSPSVSLSATSPAKVLNIDLHLWNSNVIEWSNDPYQSSTSGLPSVGSRTIINLSKILDAPNGGSLFPPDLRVVTGLESSSAAATRPLFPVERGYTPPDFVSGSVPSYMQEVTFDSADYVIEGCVPWDDNGTTKYDFVAFAFELSDSGKRLRKILQGCGYQIDFVSTEGVSILPLLAQFKAYFDIFGLELYQGWETTYCAKCIKYIENDFVTFMSSGWTGASITDTNANAFIYFIFNELLNEWYTESADYIGAHMEKLSVSPSVDVYNTPFLSIDSSGNLKVTANVADNNAISIAAGDGTQNSQNPSSVNNPLDPTADTALQVSQMAMGTSFINQLQHGQVDATVLMRMYRWTNRNSILGRAIAKVLRAQGLGKYVDECKSNFIGSSDVMVTISDVVSQAATADAALGEYGGRGLQFDSTGVLSFENDEYGYWITLAVVVPEAGYTQGLDQTLTVRKKFDFYLPDWDAIGMEMTPKSAVCATNFITGKFGQGYFGTMGFGFIPRLSKWKVCHNLVNGDFNRHGKRNTYLPYTLDRQLNLNDFSSDWSVYSADNYGNYECGVKINRSSRVFDMPIAGNVWRMPTKYAWLGNFDRIFLNIGDKETSDLSTSLSQLVGFSDYNDDNFLGHGVYAVNCYAPMKPIEESYGLEEDEPNAGGIEYTKKA